MKITAFGVAVGFGLIGVLCLVFGKHDAAVASLVICGAFAYAAGFKSII